MSIIHIKCDNCGREFDFDMDRDFVFCEYCGNKIILGQDNAESVQPQPSAAENDGDIDIDPTPTDDLSKAAEPQAPEAAPAVQPAPVAQPVPQAAPVQSFVPPARPAAAEKIEPASDLQTAIRCYNTRDYETANKCLDKLKQDDPDNFEVWFCACKVISAERPVDIRATLEKFVYCAETCLGHAPEKNGVRGNLTIDFNHLLKNITDTVVAERRYIAPYDMNVMSEEVPSINYQPLAKVDEHYFIIMDGITAFQQKVNPNYLNNYFLGIWDTAFFCFAHEITQKMQLDLAASKFFQWYKSDLANRMTNDSVYKSLCDLIYAYKNVFITLFNRLPYRDTKNIAYQKIAYLNKWLLKMKRTDQYGRTYLLISQPADRTALDVEIRNYKIMLSRS